MSFVHVYGISVLRHRPCFVSTNVAQREYVQHMFVTEKTGFIYTKRPDELA